MASRSQSAEAELAGPDGPWHCLSVRGVAIGLILCVLMGLAGPYWCFVLHSSRMFVDYHAAGQVFSLVLLLLIFNGLLAMVWRGFALPGRDLRLITAMTLSSGAVCTSGLVAYLIPGITGPFYYAGTTNELQQKVWPVLRRRLFPLDGDGGIVAITKFWSGVPSGEPTLWQPWVVPLVLWGVFLVALFACMMALMSIMRKQWMDYEHLSFPIAQVPAELCRAAESPGSSASILRSRGFWIVTVLSFLLACSGGLGHYGTVGRLPSAFSVFPTVRIRHVIQDLGPMPMAINLDLVILGLVFLIPNRVTFSIWSLSLVSWLVRSFIRTYGLQLNDAVPYSVVGHPELSHVAMGSMIAFTAVSLWMARPHLWRVLRCVMGRTRATTSASPAPTGRRWR